MFEDVKVGSYRSGRGWRGRKFDTTAVDHHVSAKAHGAAIHGFNPTMRCAVAATGKFSLPVGLGQKPFWTHK